MNSKETDKSLVKVQEPNAYNIYILEDDDSYLPDMDLGPFAKDGNIKEMEFDSIVLLSDPNYIPSK